MSTFFLHVGMHKTGSSALQDYMHRNAARVRAAGIAYPEWGPANHSALLRALFTPEERVTAERFAARGKGHLVENRTALRDRLAGFCREAAGAGQDVLLSGEGASLLGRAALRELREFALEAFGRAAVVGLVRPPRSFARSVAQQHLKAGATFDRIAAPKLAPQYRRRFETLDDVFGAEHVRLAPFHRTTMVDGDVLPTVLALIGGDRGALGGERARRRNESMSLTAAKLLSALNETIHAGRPSPALPPALRAAIERGPLARALADSRKTGERMIRHAKPIARLIASVEGPPMMLPAELAGLPEETREDAGWMSRRLGLDLLALDEPEPADPPPLAALRRFDPGETERILEAIGRQRPGDESPLRTPVGSAARAVRAAVRRWTGGGAGRSRSA